MIVTADIHLQQSSADTVLNQVFPGLIEAVDQDVDQTLVILGDLYHIRYKVDVGLQNAVSKFLVQLREKGVEVILLPGNHDQINPQGENALEVFGEHPNVRVYSVVTDDQWGRWIPYRKDVGEILEAVGRPQVKGVDKVLWMHHGIQGSYMNDHCVDKRGILPEVFSAWRRVYCGHYHKRQNFKTKEGSWITYVGSPYQINASESGQLKGYVLYQPGPNNESWVSQSWGKKYHVIDLGKGQRLDVTQFQEGDSIRVLTAPGQNPEEIGYKLKDFSDVVVSESVVASENRLNGVEVNSLRSYAQAYVDQFVEESDRQRLMGVYDKLVETL